jgi:hypothetical protein
VAVDATDFTQLTAARSQLISIPTNGTLINLAAIPELPAPHKGSTITDGRPGCKD